MLQAGDGTAGLEIMKDHPVSLVLLDLRLPGLDGWEVLREIKNNPELSRIPVVVLTAIAGSGTAPEDTAHGRRPVPG